MSNPEILTRFFANICKSGHEEKPKCAIGCMPLFYNIALANFKDVLLSDQDACLLMHSRLITADSLSPPTCLGGYGTMRCLPRCLCHHCDIIPTSRNQSPEVVRRCCGLNGLIPRGTLAQEIDEQYPKAINSAWAWPPGNIQAFRGPSDLEGLNRRRTWKRDKVGLNQ